MTTALSPVKEDRRIASLDVLRGLAMLGILVLNIQTFAMPFAAYGNPLGYGTVEGADYWVFTLSMVLGDMKFMAIFSMLFGAGMVLFVERLLETGRSAYAVHYRRMAWLLVIGLLHAYLLWYGDILVGYAMCGMILVGCRRLPPWLLLATGFAMLLLGSMLFLGLGWLIINFGPEEMARAAFDSPASQESLQYELEAYTGGWLGQMGHRAIASGMVQTFGFAFFVLWRAGGLMLVGMALYRWGVF